MLNLLATAAAVMAMASSSGTTVFLPTSQALRMAEHVARGEGYDLRDPHRYFFDLIQKDGRPFLSGYVTLGFYWNGDTANTISINETTGLTVDPVACLIFDYDSVRAERSAFRANAEPPALMSELKEQSGCDHFKTLRSTRRRTSPQSDRDRAPRP